ncbi:S-adenosyl-L-methionine-dependent methyltransferase [Dichotomopilus funicola]|uniref:S-adenosyl-L-methionine-dependent methyltransferase n=1 Tax=Dichotomopilus funicola TaxID=1934379 RepID=A0AAN6V5R3_9PEZI|nr:S-adenosyl-L-methionine-dependent methyltransferase [Dichotomopilus funicola]
MPVDFGNPSYWHGRFLSETSFEWLAPSAAFIEIIEPHLRHLSPSARILHLGPGTSDLHNHLRARGFTNVLNVDYEPLALERGQQLERERFGSVKTSYLVADATSLELPQKYQLVIDKSTVDAVACGEDGALISMGKAVRGCLEKEGLWISLSYSAARFDDLRDLYDVEILARIPTPRQKSTDPEIFHHCYLLRPRFAETR